MGEQVRRPLTEGVGVKPTTQKPVIRAFAADSLMGMMPTSPKPAPVPKGASPTPRPSTGPIGKR